MNPQWRRRRWSLLPTTLLLLHLLPPPSAAVDYGNLYATCNSTTRFRCGKTEYEIYYPFNFVSDTAASSPAGCGRPDYNLTCDEEASALMLQTGDGDKRYRVLEFNYSDRSLTIGYPVFYGDPCSSSPPSLWNTTVDPALFDESHGMVGDITLVNCTSFSDSNVENVSCLSSTSGSNRYYLFYTPFPNLYPACEIAHVKMNQTALQYLQSSSIDLLLALREGFTVTWKAGAGACDGCDRREGICTYDGSSKREECVCSDGLCSGAKDHRGHITVIVIAATAASSFLLICAVLFYAQRRILRGRFIVFHSESNNLQRIEAFLEENGHISPVRYKYSDLKRITRSFREKLGHGGYGTVFRGTLQDGRMVAVKMLDNSRGDGGEFINEVASIGRTSHVNVVRLLGFCLQGQKRALVYEFMSNGSLDKFICSDEQRRSIGWKRLHAIAVGIARGLEYLHRGCNTRIVHFDIKPHNILLDDEFCPKIADFGLAKLGSRKDSIISMLDARGTAGYIAPEVFCRNFGAVSTKSDVYSYGMMVLEMTGATTNPTSSDGNSSDGYFPHWVYKQLEHDGDLQALGENSETAKMLILVGLWCIQTMPANRPSIRRVIEMLEGKMDDIEYPPEPSFLSPPLLSALYSSSLQ